MRVSRVSQQKATRARGWKQDTQNERDAAILRQRPLRQALAYRILNGDHCHHRHSNSNRTATATATARLLIM